MVADFSHFHEQVDTGIRAIMVGGADFSDAIYRTALLPSILYVLLLPVVERLNRPAVANA